MKFIIDYHTGVTHEIEAADLNEAKKAAEEGIAYTQEYVTIKDADGTPLVKARWYGVKPDEDDEVLCEIGGGFYTDWQDE